METHFSAPQMISQQDKVYGLDKIEKAGNKYYELKKEQDRYKRTEKSVVFSDQELAKQIKEGGMKVLMPSKAYLQQKNNEQFNEQFKAPAMIQKSEHTYGFDKHEAQQLSYYKLEKEGSKWKRTAEKLETSPDELVKGIKSGEVKVLMANKEFVKQREGEKKTAADKQEHVPPIDIQPVHVEPLTARQRQEVKEAIAENKLQDDKHASHLFKKFDRQLGSVPDHINGQQMSNQDKLKLLVGDYNDHQNSSYRVQKDKTIAIEGKEKGMVSNLNSSYSDKQKEKMNERAVGQGKEMAV